MIKVLIVDDSAVVRNFMKDILSSDHEIDVVGTAPDPFIARDKILKYSPDVITLDVEMPRMDGITFLKKLMKYYPIPVVIVSSLTQQGAATTIEAMEEGAVEIIAKPHIDLVKGMEQIAGEIIRKVKNAASARLKKKKESASERPATLEKIEPTALKQSTNKIIAIGASTGGTEAIREVLVRLPANTPGIVIVQHMPEKFTRAFAERLNSLSDMEVKEAQDGDAVIPGRALIAPGNYHMELRRSGARYYVALNQGVPVHHQRPSADVLFESVSRYAGTNAVGVIMTGMGADGAMGLLSMKKAGAMTVAQDEESCVVFGMPKEAIKLDAVDKIVSLEKIPGAIISMAS